LSSCTTNGFSRRAQLHKVIYFTYLVSIVLSYLHSEIFSNDLLRAVHEMSHVFSPVFLTQVAQGSNVDPEWKLYWLRFFVLSLCISRQHRNGIFLPYLSHFIRTHASFKATVCNPCSRETPLSYLRSNISLHFFRPVVQEIIVACRPLAGQRAWDKQIYKSHCWVTALQTYSQGKDWSKKWAMFSKRSLPRGHKRDKFRV
jgi:hypothetical protein